MVAETESSDSSVKTLGFAVGGFDSLSQFEIHKAFKRLDEFGFRLLATGTDDIPNLLDAERGGLSGFAGLLHGRDDVILYWQNIVKRLSCLSYASIRTGRTEWRCQP